MCSRDIVCKPGSEINFAAKAASDTEVTQIATKARDEAARNCFGKCETIIISLDIVKNIGILNNAICS